jgi:carbamoyl-phosphate synthase large subunit
VVATVERAHLPDQQGPDVKRVRCARGRPHIVDRLLDGGIHLVINTTGPRRSRIPPIRRNALLKGSPTTRRCRRRAAVGAIADLRAGKTTVRSLQEYQNG